ncbi:hypothetical protein E0D81_11730 [Lelliottia amnigena]|uniref:Secreted protein n=1 Tax=Lelliottia aquatilis TaxID=2080838 RepID=A0ABX5A5W3_9ENTR|nr:hypothetical protein DAI21_18960 [Lelliottia sp. WB101]POZ14264.1 hypothetical protein C3Z09_19260 [Lelliottia aquatilis]POZ28216.1 hypothetical protein C3708_05270 [Lelliottia sp. 7254-16]RXJ22153.1 hypothetical protein ETG88_00725 [Lelliottia nimipressuralis]TCD18877.1 hypothetical protein E0D81_11730 [Lelliottia amnigena]
MPPAYQVLSFGAACATVAKPASATAIAIAVFFIFCASLSSKNRHEDLVEKSRLNPSPGGELKLVTLPISSA